MNRLGSVANATRPAEVMVEPVSRGAGAMLRAGTVGVLIAAPLAFGATAVASSAVLIAAAWLLFLIWLGSGIRTGQLRVPAHPIAVPAILLLGYTAVHWLAGISVAPYATQMEWLRWVGYAVLALIGVAAFDTPRRLERLLAWLATAGFLIAVLGIAQNLTSNGKLYWMIELESSGWFFGPYVNHNHFAGLMELWMPLALCFTLIPGKPPVIRWMWFGMAVVMGAGVVLSGSRGGLLSMGVQLVALTLAAAALKGGRRAIVVLAIAIVLVGSAVWALADARVIGNFASVFQSRNPQIDSVAGNRVAAWRDTLEMFRQRPVLGSGLETFAALFPGVRSFWSDKFWSHAHNDYLQFLAETGAIGGLLALSLFVMGTREAARNLRHYAGRPMGALMVGLVCGCLGFLVHGWWDFNFHVPANAANFAVLAAMLVRRGWDED